MAQAKSASDWMLQAIEVARQGEGYVEPNPMVGCVLVENEEVIGVGYHERFGGPHAERNAIADAQERGFASRLAESEAFVTLEPCCHHGKTPPCTEALLEAQVARVVVGCEDPFSEVAGKGIARLRESGVHVEVGCCATEVQELLGPYLKRVRFSQPWMIAKWAMSLDGRIATKTGDSQWISGAESRKQVHQLRGRVDAILVGSGTALADDPLLTARTEDEPIRRQALRVVVDSQLTLPMRSQLVATAKQHPTLIWAGPELRTSRALEFEKAGIEVVSCQESGANDRLLSLLQFLAQEKTATNVLVEGGARLLGSLFTLDAVDECQVYVAPLLIGGDSAPGPIGGLGVADLAEATRFETLKIHQTGKDAFLSCRRHPRS